AELAVDIRPPSLEKDYLDAEGQPRFKHLIEPSVTYRASGGIGNEVNRIIRFDERDAVADTNEVEYAIVNRFFTRQLSSELTRRRVKGRRAASQMKPVRPGEKEKGSDKKKTGTEPADAKPPEPAGDNLTQEQKATAQPPARSQHKSTLATGESTELTPA